LESLYRAFHVPGSRAYRWVDGFVWVLIAISIALFAVEVTIPSPEEIPPVGDRSALEAFAAVWVGLAPVLQWVDLGILTLFAVELALRVLTFRPPGTGFYDRPLGEEIRAQVWGRVKFLLQPLNLIDLFVLFAVVPALRGLRALRLLRLARAVRFFRYANPITDVIDAFHANRLLYQAAFTFLGVITAVGGLSIYLVERRENDDINSVADGLWWALVTLTTVGFGDISPITPLGRAVGSVLMVAGMFTLALFAGIVGNTLLNAILRIRQEQFRMGNSVGHVIVFGYDSGSRQLLDAMIEEYDQARIVIMAQGEAPMNLPDGVEWVSGDPTKEAELDKIRMVHAEGVVVAGRRGLNPEQADAVTLLTLFTLRSYLRRQKPLPRRRPLYVVAEILDPENVEHARTAGADEVIESTRLGFSLIAHAIAEPGTGTVMSRVTMAGAHNLYVAAVPADLPLPTTFGEAFAHLRRGGEVMLIGTRDPASGQDRLNPPDDLVLDGTHQLVYLAERPVLKG